MFHFQEVELTLTIEFSEPPISKYQWIVGITPKAAQDTNTAILMFSLILRRGIWAAIEIKNITTMTEM